MDTVNDKLCRYEKQSLNNVVKDDVEDVNTLYKQFNKFMDQPFKHRRNADNVSISITGFTNQQRYESQLRDLIKQEAAYTEIDMDKVEAAKKWSIDSNIVMLYPCDDIDTLYNQYLSQPKDLRRRADWQALELFGVNNITLYSMLKNNISNIKLDNKDDIYTLGKCLVDLDKTFPDTFTESVELDHIKKNILNKIKKISKKEEEYKCECMYVR